MEPSYEINLTPCPDILQHFYITITHHPILIQNLKPKPNSLPKPKY